MAYSEPGKIVLLTEDWTNTYNADGLRTKRSNGTTTYNYIYNGSSLSQMTVGSNTLYFAYDASGSPMSVTYNDTNYYYATNLQGDVTAILNTSGTAVVKYTYDAWGNILTTTGSMAETLGEINPLRYRGYVYDTEAHLYYLQSRYYDPEMGRFITADAFVSTGQGILGNNMFAYCRNSPVFRIDVSGTCDIQCGDENPMNAGESNNDFGPGGVKNTASTGTSSTNCYNGTANNCLRIGGGHGNPIHKATINIFMDKLVNSGEYKAVYGNRALKTAGLNGSQQPDIIAISNDGIYEVWEFASPSQATGIAGYRALETKIQVMQLANPNARIHEIVPWEGVAPR